MSAPHATPLSFLKRRQQCFVAGLLMLAILWMALAPHIAHVVALKTGKAWIELCSATGVKRIEVDRASLPMGALVLDEQGAPNVDHRAKTHCLYCATHHDQILFAMPDASWWLRQLDLSHRWVKLDSFILSIRAHWPAHQTRAPPV